jgi:DNA polymerase elongation subunit (family B)
MYGRNTLKEIYETLMYTRDIEKCTNIARTRIGNLLRGNQFDPTELVMTASLRDEYKSTNVPHAVLADKMKRRDPNNYPKPGERVPYIIIDNGETKLCDKVEDPSYRYDLEGFKIDYLYYLQHQLQTPIEELFELLYENTSNKFKIDVFFEKQIKISMSNSLEIYNKVQNKKNHQLGIQSFFKKK